MQTSFMSIFHWSHFWKWAEKENYVNATFEKLVTAKKLPLNVGETWDSWFAKCYLENLLTLMLLGFSLLKHGFLIIANRTVAKCNFCRLLPFSFLWSGLTVTIDSFLRDKIPYSV